MQLEGMFSLVLCLQRGYREIFGQQASYLVTSLVHMEHCDHRKQLQGELN